MSARERILDTFEAILTAEGERGATLDAVAAKAGVSKGGLLYHFGSRDALVAGLVQRGDLYAAEYLELLRTAEAGSAIAYIRSCAETDTPFDHTFIALGRLSGDQHPDAMAALRRAQQDWVEVIGQEISDRATARAIVLMGDGLYYNALLHGEADHDVEGLLRVVTTLIAADRCIAEG